MVKKTVAFNFSEKEVDRAIAELNDYKKEVLRKLDILREKIAQRLADEANAGFNGAIVDDLIKEERYANVDVSVDNRGQMTVVIARGEDAVWVEFGTGVYYNRPAGSSPHPQGVENGMTIGGYGKGHGKKEAWGFYENGQLKISRGTPARMPMVKAVFTICNELPEIVKEVFG